jgi:hypothetical protein
MPAIASLEDLKAAQKEGVSICAMRWVVGLGRIELDLIGLTIPHSAFGNPHLVGPRTVER